jgi:hypothetical protein
MTKTELFLNAVDSYKTWVKTGMDFVSFSNLYDAWDDAVQAYAAEMNISRSDACTQVYCAIEMELN